ncbi:MAG: helix-turn-helix domain-containing protein [Leucobacter sp.]
MTPIAQASPETGAHTPLLDFSSFSVVASSAFVPLTMNSHKRSSFRGYLRTAEVDRLAFTELYASAHDVERTPSSLSQGGDHYMVGMMLSGTGMLVQSGRELVLHEGDITIYDTGQPFSLSFENDSKNFVMMVPKDMLSLPQELIGELTATRLPGDSRAGVLASQFLLQVPQAINNSFHEVNVRLARTSVDLLETLLAVALGAERLEQNPHQVLLRKIREHIDARLSSPDLNPSQIAAAHHISTRHLHGLFRSQGITVSGYIRSHRLDRCRQDLMSPLFADKPVAAIAARYGFIDAAHFSRVFRAHFGMTPSEVRARR